MATEGGVSDHPIINEEVKEEVKAVETKHTEEVKIEEQPCVTEEATDVTKFEPVIVDELIKVDEETSKTEDMALENETKMPVVEVEEKKTETIKVEPLTEAPAVKDNEKITETVKVEKEKITDEVNVPAVDMEKTEEKKEETDSKSAVFEDIKKDDVVTTDVVKCSETKKVEPIVSVQEETTDINKKEELKQELAEKVVEIADKKLDEQVVVKEPEITEKKDAPIVEEKKSVPADEIAIKETKEKIEKTDGEFETIKIEEAVKKDEETTKDSSTNKTVENGTQESNNEKGSEKPALEPVKTESKEEKTGEETKSTPKEEDKTTPKSAGGIMGKVKKSFFKAKKAITGNKNTATSTTTGTKPAETKEDEKA